MKKVLCIGHSAYDFTIPLKSYPAENNKYRVDRFVECGGGPAGNAAYLLGKWGSECYYAGAVGDDLYGRRIINELKSVNVNIDYLEIIENERTPFSFIIVNEENGSRTIFNYSDEDLHINKDKIDLKPDVILADGYDHDISLKTIEENPDAISIMDAGRFKEETLPLAKKVDYLVCSKDYAEAFTNKKIDNNYEEIFSLMEQTFTNHIIITLEEKGCIYKVDNEIKHIGVIKRKAVDTTGTGDIFHGGFTYGILNGYTMEESIKIGTIAAGLSIERMGGRNSVFPLEEVMKLYNEKVI
jgi:sugar/nucleoside kinase (ribokinase family)